jgi:hypothetical protein
VFDAELLQLGFVLLQFGDGGVAVHACNITQLQDGLG